MTDNPKVMFNQGEGKFTAMDPKDDNLVNKIYIQKTQSKRLINWLMKLNLPHQLQSITNNNQK